MIKMKVKIREEKSVYFLFPITHGGPIVTLLLTFFFIIQNSKKWFKSDKWAYNKKLPKQDKKNQKSRRVKQKTLIGFAFIANMWMVKSVSVHKKVGGAHSMATWKTYWVTSC